MGSTGGAGKVGTGKAWGTGGAGKAGTGKARGTGGTGMAGTGKARGTGGAGKAGTGKAWGMHIAQVRASAGISASPEWAPLGHLAAWATNMSSGCPPCKSCP